MLRCGTSDKRHSGIAKDVQTLSRTPANNIGGAQFNASQTPSGLSDAYTHERMPAASAVEPQQLRGRKPSWRGGRFCPRSFLWVTNQGAELQWKHAVGVFVAATS